PLGTFAAAIPHMKSDHLAARGIHGDPDPRLVGLLVDKAGHCIRFHLQALDHDVLLAGDGLDVEMIRQCLQALDEKTQQPLVESVPPLGLRPKEPLRLPASPILRSMSRPRFVARRLAVRRSGSLPLRAGAAAIAASEGGPAEACGWVAAR